MKNRDDHPELDALLKSEAQQAVQKAVKALPDEGLSLAWRSSINERLRAAQPESRWKARARAAWRPAFGLALASCLAIALTFRTPQTQQSVDSPNLEASLVSTYDDSANADTVAGPGLAVHEVSDTTHASDSSTDWTESDLNAL